MAAIMTVFAAAGLVVSEKKTKTMLLRTPNQALRTPPLVIEAAGQRYRRATQFLYLGCRVNARPTLCQISKRRVQLAWACFKRFKREICHMEAAPFYLMVRGPKTERSDGDPAVRASNVGPRLSLIHI